MFIGLSLKEGLKLLSKRLNCWGFKARLETESGCEVLRLVSVRITEQGLFNPVKGTMTCISCDGLVERQAEWGAEAIYSLKGYASRASLHEDLMQWCRSHLSEGTAIEQLSAVGALQVGNG